MANIRQTNIRFQFAESKFLYEVIFKIVLLTSLFIAYLRIEGTTIPNLNVKFIRYVIFEN